MFDSGKRQPSLLVFFFGFRYQPMKCRGIDYFQHISPTFALCLLSLLRSRSSLVFLSGFSSPFGGVESVPVGPYGPVYIKCNILRELIIFSVAYKGTISRSGSCQILLHGPQVTFSQVLSSESNLISLIYLRRASGRSNT